MRHRGGAEPGGDRGGRRRARVAGAPVGLLRRVRRDRPAWAALDAVSAGAPPRGRGAGTRCAACLRRAARRCARPGSRRGRPARPAGSAPAHPPATAVVRLAPRHVGDHEGPGRHQHTDRHPFVHATGAPATSAPVDHASRTSWGRTARRPPSGRNGHVPPARGRVSSPSGERLGRATAPRARSRQPAVEPEPASGPRRSRTARPTPSGCQHRSSAPRPRCPPSTVPGGRGRDRRRVARVAPLLGDLARVSPLHAARSVSVVRIGRPAHASCAGSSRSTPSG